MLAHLVAYTLASQPGIRTDILTDTTPITYTHMAASPQAIVAELAQKLGQTLTVAEALRSNIIIVQVKDVPVKELMTRLAKESGGYWLLEKDHYNLAAKQNVDDDMSPAKVQKRLDMLKKKLAKLDSVLKLPTDEKKIEEFMRKQMEGQQMAEGDALPVPQSQSDAMSYETLSPDFRVFARLFKGLDLNRLAKLKAGERIVYATDPTQMQTNLNVGNVFQTYIAENTAYTKIATKIAKEWREKHPVEAGGDDGGDGEDFASPESMGQRFDPAKLSKVYFIVGRNDANMGQQDSYDLQVQAYTKGENGEMAPYPVFDTSQNIYPGESMVYNDDAQKKFEELSKPKPDDKFTEYRPESIEHAKIFANRYSRDEKKLLPKDWTEKQNAYFMDPLTYDPLSFATSDLLTQWATYRKQNMCARVPDALFGVVSDITGEQRYSFRMLNGFAEMDAFLIIPKEEGWFSLLPGQGMSTGGNLNRSTLAQIAQTLKVEKSLNFDTIAELVASGVAFGYDGLMTQYSAIFGSISYEMFQDLKGLKLYGLLTKSQRASLKHGDNLNLANLSEKAFAAVNSIVYGHRPRLVSTPDAPADGVPTPPNDDENQERNEEYGYYGGYGIANEPTEVFPTGLPKNGFLTFAEANRVVIASYLGPDDNSGDYYQQGPDEIGRQKYYSEHAEIFPWVREQTPRDYFKVIHRATSKMRINLTPKYYSLARLGVKDNADDKAKKAVRMDALPADVLEKINKSYEQCKIDYKDAKPGQYGESSRPAKTKP